VKARTLLLVSSLITLLMVGAGYGEEREKLALKPVLLVIDMQNVWMPEMAGEDRNSAPQKINEAIALFREFGHPIIRVYHSDPERGPEPNSTPFEFPDSIATTDDDYKIVKSHPSAFTKTTLEQDLQELDCNIVFVCGLSATGCVLATYFGAKDRGFLCVMIKGALLSHNADYTKVIEDICTSMTIEEVRDTLEDPFL
jgi:nicotinamidase-related amidase